MVVVAAVVVVVGRTPGTSSHMSYAGIQRKQPRQVAVSLRSSPRAEKKNSLSIYTFIYTMIYGKILEIYRKICEIYVKNGLVTGHLSYRRAIGSIGNEFAASI